MSNSSLVNYTKLSPNYNKRNQKITKITIHHMGGNLSVEQCGNVFSSSSREASANYGIDSQGRVGLYVEEKNRSWCSSNAANDNAAITIEVANDGGAPNWHVSDTALHKLVDLCVDICKRNGIKKLNYTGDATGNLTMHCWFAATICPGPYLKSKFKWIAEQVNKRLNPVNTATPRALYRVRKTWADATSQIGAFADLANAQKACDKAGAAYSVFNANGKKVYPTFTSYKVKVMTDALNIRSGPGTGYKINGCIRDNGVYTIVKEQNGFGQLKSGTGWICLDYTVKV